jgi:hypothetical protein
MTDEVSLIEELQKYDNEEGYKLSYDEVENKLSDTIRKLTEKGESILDDLHPLLLREETWSCLFALRIIGDIKSQKSIPYLINFIKKNEDGDYWDSCEDAMFALSAIGDSAVEFLLGEIKADFENEIYTLYLVGSLTRIRNDRVYSFMKEIVEDYIRTPEKYKEWFYIDHFVYDFEVQGKKEILPLLKELISMDLSEHEKREIQDTINIIENPRYFEQKTWEIPGIKVGRNEPCPCGSGKKYKKCCMGKESKGRRV